jgi:hypothetical protein
VDDSDWFGAMDWFLHAPNRSTLVGVSEVLCTLILFSLSKGHA